MSAMITINEPTFVPQDSQPFLLEEQKPIIEKIQSLSEGKFSTIAIPTIKNWFKEFKQQSYSKSTLKILVLLLYSNLLGIGGLTSYASLNLLLNGDFSSALSSNVDSRVNFANNITNAGALFGCITDFPAISYIVYLFVGEEAYKEAVHELWDANYHSCVKENPTLTPEMHEELYQRHLSKLKSFGIDDFYRNPDLLSTTGAMYEQLSPILKVIDEEIKKGVSISDLAKNCIEAFKQDSCVKKSAKITAGSFCLFMMALSSFIILENGILLINTSVGSLFFGNKTEQNDEAFYLTQLGGFFSSLTAGGAAIYLSFRLFLQYSYKQTMREKINACFAKYTPRDLPTTMINALYRIKEIKLRKYM